MVSAGAAFVGIKASQLTPDNMFPTYWHDAKAAGLPRMAYHLIDWRMDTTAQAVMFCSLLKDDPGELPPVLDLEMTQKFMTDCGYVPLTAKEIQGRAWAFLTAVEKATGRVPIIYTGYYYWIEWMTPDPAWAKYPLWLAWYEDEGIIKVPPPWTKWAFWQYSANGNGPAYGSTGLSMDMNVYNGTVADLLRFASPAHPAICPTCGQNWPQEAPHAPPPQYPAYKTLYRLNVRQGADEHATAYPVPIQANTIIYVDTELNEYSHFQPIAAFPAGGWVYSSYIIRI